jgi:hypothetical protein
MKMVISRSILISCFIVCECSYLDKIENYFKFDLKLKICEILNSIISRPNVD